MTKNKNSEQLGQIAVIHCVYWRSKSQDTRSQLAARMCSICTTQNCDFDDCQSAPIRRGSVYLVRCYNLPPLSVSSPPDILYLSASTYPRESHAFLLSISSVNRYRCPAFWSCLYLRQTLPLSVLSCNLIGSLL